VGGGRASVSADGGSTPERPPPCAGDWAVSDGRGLPSDGGCTLGLVGVFGGGERTIEDGTPATGRGATAKAGFLGDAGRRMAGDGGSMPDRLSSSAGGWERGDGRGLSDEGDGSPASVATLHGGKTVESGEVATGCGTPMDAGCPVDDGRWLAGDGGSMPDRLPSSAGG
jgi:hypothetical protein